MAGTLPGVGNHRRMKVSSQRLHDDTIFNSRRRSWAEPPPVTVVDGGAAMDEAALRARRRLEEKLGYFRPSRHNRTQTNEGRQMTSTEDKSYPHLLSRMLLTRRWKLNSNKNRSTLRGQLCVVCLEDFALEQQVMELPCTHKYHSKCLIPWLVSHSNCPSCRSPVKPY